MELTFRAFVQFSTLVTTVGGKHTDLLKKCFLSLPDVVIFSNEPEIKLIHSSNHTEHCRKLPFHLASTKHDFTSAKCILYGIHRLIVTNKERSPFPRANHCPGQLRTPESVSISAVPMKHKLSTLVSGS